MRTELEAAVTYLRSPVAIRTRCEAIYKAAVAGQCAHFTIDHTQLPAVVERVVTSQAPRNELAVPEEVVAALAKLGGGVETPLAAPDHDATWPHRLIPAVEATQILKAVLEHFPPATGRKLEGVELGDVGKHPAAGGTGVAAGLVPLHAQAIALSVAAFDALENAGYTVSQPGALPGVADERTGGLFVDGGVLVPKYMEVREIAHAPGDEVIVEWRALTVALLDVLAKDVRQVLNRSSTSLPLASLLGQAREAGRAIAAERRPGGGSPIRVSR